MVAVPTVFIYDKNKKPYSLSEVCKKLGVSRSWLYIHRKHSFSYESLKVKASEIPRSHNGIKQRVNLSDIKMGSWEK